MAPVHSIGVHDVGGEPGFGTVPMGDESAPAYPEGWEGKTAGAIIGSILAGLFNVDQFRAGIEGLAPLAYMRTSYWEKWQHTLEYNLIRNSVLSREEIEARLHEFASEPQRPLPDSTDEEGLATIKAVIEHGAPITRELDEAPAFDVGDVVTTREIHIEQPGFNHTRLPGYAQRCRGAIEIVHPAMPLPDVNAEGKEERAEYVYAVRFSAEDLWPDAEPGTSVCADLWQSYLEAAA